MNEQEVPMAAKTDPTLKPRVPLTRERVLSTAIVLADEGGIESLSMRKLGQELGVEAMSLYNHVANKGDLLDGMVDVVASKFEVASKGGNWKTAIRRSAISAHEVLLRHPWACSLAMSRPKVGPAKLRQVDSMVGRLRKAGFSIQMAHNAMHAIENHISGFTLQELSFPKNVEEMGPEVVAILLRREPVGEYQDLSEVVLGAVHDDQIEFEFVLDLILDGLERVRDRT
jgi:AcrR family transcriptional regulator